MSSSHTEATVAVQMPQMGISVSEGTILEWRKAVGDPVAADEPIADVTTDKVDVEIPCPAAGVLREDPVPSPATPSPVGEVIAEIDTATARRLTPSPRRADNQRPATSYQQRGGRPLDVRLPRRPPDGRASTASTSRQVEGHGIGGRIRKKDLLAHIEADSPRTSPRGRSTSSRRTCPSRRPAAGNGHEPATLEGRREEMSPMRKAIAEHMVRSRHDGRALHDDRRGRLLGGRSASRRAEGVVQPPRGAAHLPGVRRPGGGRGARGVSRS